MRLSGRPSQKGEGGRGTKVVPNPERCKQVHIVAWLDADESALCAITEADGAIWAAANVRLPGRAVEHIRHHVARGFTGTLMCSVYCQG